MTTERTDALGYSGVRENLVVTIDQVILNSWNEMLVSRYDGPDALLACLRDYLNNLPASVERPGLRVRCFCRNRAQAIGQRVQELFDDAQELLGAAGVPRFLLQVQQRFHVLQLEPGQVSHASLADLPALVEHLGRDLPGYSPLQLDRHALEDQDLAVILPLGRPNCIQVFYRQHGEAAEISLLDEHNALWRQRLPFRDEQSLLTPLHRFLQSLLYRRNALLPLDSPVVMPTPEIFYYEVVRQGRQLERRAAPPAAISHPFYDVQAIVEPAEQGLVHVTLYCNHREFSELEYGAGLFVAVARHILAQRREPERYPCYITDLDLSRVPGRGQAQTVHYLRYKVELEERLNRALRDG